MTQTPEENLSTGVLVFADYLAGSYFYLFYNIFSAALRAIGVSERTLYVLILTTVVKCISGCIPGWHLPPRCPGAQSLRSSRRRSLRSPSLSISGKKCRFTARHPGSETENLDAQKNDRFQLHFRRPADDSLRRPPARPCPASMRSVSMQLPLLMPSPSSTATCSPRATASRHLSRRSRTEPRAKEYDRIPKGLRKMLVIRRNLYYLDSGGRTVLRPPLLGIF